MKKYASVLQLAARWGWELLWSIVLVSVGIAYITTALGIGSQFWTQALNSTIIVVLALLIILLRKVSEWFLRWVLKPSSKKAVEVTNAAGS